MKLNLGCSDNHREGFVNVDRVPPADQIVDLAKPWPWPESSIVEVLAHDIVEHLPDKIHTMNELWRVLRPGGRVEIVVPDGCGPGQHQDPTHVSAWVLNSFQYFEEKSFARVRFGVAYGIQARFRIIDLTKRDTPDAKEPVPKITAILEAVK
jgi:SAM-dependent methyltransferase